jgi:hypothetical protein
MSMMMAIGLSQAVISQYNTGLLKWLKLLQENMVLEISKH